MYALARETKAIMPTALFTTTHIMTPSDADVVLSVPFSAEECRAAWREGKIASSGTFLSEERKFGAPEEETMCFLCREASAVIIEADGARRLPVKFPAAWEPVIRPETTHTVVVAGLSALGKNPEEIVHRYALAKESVDLSGDLLTEKQQEVIEYYYNEDLSLAEIAEHSGITRQGVRDSIKRAEAQLRAFEEQLGLAARFHEIKEKLEDLL